MHPPPSLFLVEDDPGVTLSLVSALGRPETGFFLCASSTCAESALAVVEEHQVDLFVVDWKLPGMDGLEFIARLKSIHPKARAVLLTGHPSQEVTLRAVAAGADGILHKPFDLQELIRSLHAAYVGHCAVTPEAARHLVDWLRDSNSLNLADSDGQLSKREREVLQLLGTGLTAKETAERLGLTSGTVATYRKQAFKKLGVHKLCEARGKLRGAWQSQPITRW